MASGVTKEGLMGWETDRERYDLPEWAKKVISAYRLLKRADRMEEAAAVRECGNRVAMLELRVQEVERRANEGKIGQSWEAFIEPFGKMDREQVSDWIENFKQGWKDARMRYQQSLSQRTPD